jgi:hypothetical protein
VKSTGAITRVLFALAAFYAGALVVMLAADTWLGTRQWLEDLLYGSRRQLAWNMLAWGLAAAWAAVPAAFLATLAGRHGRLARAGLTALLLGAVFPIALGAWWHTEAQPLTVEPTAASGQQSLLLFGGGPVPMESEVSIEKNVVWIDELMRDRPFAYRETLFAGGPEGPRDVILHLPDDPQVQRWLPLARVYGKQHAARSVFRRNVVPGNAGAAIVEAVENALERAVGALGPGDGLFLVYNGHGSFDGGDRSRNALRLWGESRLDVQQFAELLEGAPAGATVRFFLPQCFSGAFTRSILAMPEDPELADVARNRCGFVAVPDYQESEGCTPGVDVGEYRDYSTFFFAALAGRTRLGAPLERDPDTDGDGVVSLREAHDYAFTEGLSADMPQRTSEYLLELWAPDWARWLTVGAVPADKVYLPLAARLAQKLNLTRDDPRAWAREALARRQAAEATISALAAERTKWMREEREIRTELRRRFEREWPNAAVPHAVAFEVFVAEELTPALAWIMAQPEYPTLAALQDRIEQSELEILEVQREAAQYIRVRRAVYVATLRAQFSRSASQSQREAYLAIAGCEEWVLPEPKP